MLKSLFLKTVLSISVFILFLACSNNEDNNPNNEDDNPEPVQETSIVSEDNQKLNQALKVETYKNLKALPKTIGHRGGSKDTGKFTKFSFSKNEIVNDNNWDIAFRGTDILVNGGNKIGIADEPKRTGKASICIVNGILSNLKTIPNEADFKQDGHKQKAIVSGNKESWYNYNVDLHIITPLSGKILLIKTHDEKYVKMEITSFYKNSIIANENAYYYTFRYVYQPNGNTF